MTAQVDGHDPVVDRPDDWVVDGIDGNRWARLTSVERAVVDQLATAGTPALHRQHMQRAGRPAVAGHVAEISVTAGRGIADRLELLDTAEASARELGKPVGAVARRVSGRVIVTLSLDGFAALLRAATPPAVRDEPVTEVWPLGTGECAVCGSPVMLRSAPQPGRLPVCSEKCRTQRRRVPQT